VIGRAIAVATPFRKIWKLFFKKKERNDDPKVI